MAARRRSGAKTEHRRAPVLQQSMHIPEQAAAPAPGSAALAAIIVGRLLPGSTPYALLVDYPGNSAGPVSARSAMTMDVVTVDRAVATGQGAVLAFENGDARMPIVTGLIWTGQPVTPFQELLVSPRPAARKSRAPLEARLDGERVVLEGKLEVVLKCGEASITLRRDGKIMLRGAYVESYAKGVNRIKGASVKIN